MTGESSVLIEAEGLVLGYGRRRILADVSLRILQGEYWCILGPNGEGKTTLLRAILGLLRPLGGRLRLHPDIADRRRIGFVPQRCELNPALPITVREFISLGTVGIPMGGAERKIRMAETLARVGLAGLERRSYWSLSGGQRQRTHLARALVRRPTLLILDETTAGLDFSIEEAFLGSLGRMHREEGITVLVVTHDLEVAREHATHAALVHGGRVRSGPCGEVLTAGSIQDAYGVEDRAGAAASGGGRA
jgi:ABC-type Mn2+/Zn2+ transport system ATPase subunit